MLLHTAAAAGSSITMNDPIIRLTSSLKQMRERCGVDGVYDACTRFVAYRLDATCAADGGLWRMQAAAKFTPFVVLLNIRSLPHEKEHIGDMLVALRGYVDALERNRFDSETACHEIAVLQMNAFESTIRAFASESTLLRDPTLKSPSRTDPAHRR